MANLTSKELTALEDQLGNEQALVKKYRAMATMCTDQKIKSDLESIATKHQQHYSTLVSFLQ